MKNRRGHSLIECLVAFTLLGATLSTIGLTLHTLSRSEREVRQAVDTDRDFERFAERLRLDAHGASAAAVEDATEPVLPQAVLRLELPDEQTVGYTLQANRIERILRRGVTVLHRESYQLPASCNASWKTRGDRRVPVVSLVLNFPARAGSAKETRRIDAAIQLLRSPSVTSKS